MQSAGRVGQGNGQAGRAIRRHVDVDAPGLVTAGGGRGRNYFQAGLASAKALHRELLRGIGEIGDRPRLYHAQEPVAGSLGGGRTDWKSRTKKIG